MPSILPARIDWAFLHGVNAIRFLLNAVLAAAIAGYASTLVKITDTVVTWILTHAFRQLADWGVGTVLAVLGAAIFTVFCLIVLLIVESVLQFLAAVLIGRDNAVGAWLDENLPAKLERTNTYVFFQLNFPIEFHWYADRNGVRIRRRSLERLRNHERRLSREDEYALVEQVANALVRKAPPQWERLRLDYRCGRA